MHYHFKLPHQYYKIPSIIVSIFQIMKLSQKGNLFGLVQLVSDGSGVWHIPPNSRACGQCHDGLLPSGLSMVPSLKKMLRDVCWSEVCSCFHRLQHFNYLYYHTPLSPCELIWICYFDTLNCKVGAFLLRKDWFQGDSEPRSSQWNWSDAVTWLCSVPGWAVSWLLSPRVPDVHLTGPSGQR